MMGVILEVSKLSKQFGDLKAVNDLSFTVFEKDIYGFLGQNGAGKSTTIRMLLTLIKPTGGSIRAFDKDLADHPNEVLRQTGAIIERPDLYKYLSAYDNLSIFAKLSGVKLKRAALMEQLDRVGLADRSKSKVKTFSQGMKQRLGIAVALVHDPKLIILDEPTNGLDPQGIADMRNLLIDLSRKHGKTVIVSSHLLAEIEVIATRMIIIHKGRKMAEGNVAELLDPARTTLVLETTDNKLALIKLTEMGFVSNERDSGGALQLDVRKDGIPDLISRLVAEGISILSVQPRHSLEEYFLSLTNQANVDTFAN